MLSSLRIAIRSLARRPAVALVAIASLAVGIGVNSTVFSIVDAMYLRPPAVDNPENLVLVLGKFKDGGTVLDWADYLEIAGRQSAFSAATATMSRGGTWRNGQETVSLNVDAVGDNYFQMLGVKPHLGRLPDPGDASAAASEPPLVLAHWLWREHMGGRTDVIGQRMEFRNRIWRIAAVLPPEFRGLSTMDQCHVWIPAASWLRHFGGDFKRGLGQFAVVARLRSGVSIEQAQAQLDVLARQIEASDSKVPKGRRLAAISLAQGRESGLHTGRIVMALVALVLLVACANVAAVLLAYAETRRREIGLRLALGAGRPALAGQFLIESALLAAVGAAAGWLLAIWLIGVVPALAPPSSTPIHYDFRIDLRLLLFTAGCAAATLLVSGLAPLGYTLRVSLSTIISGSRTAGRGQRSVLRYLLVNGQVALSVVLVGGAIALLASLGEARKIYPGYDTSRPLALIEAYPTTRAGSRPEHLIYQEAAGRIASVGGVEAVTWARHLPLVDASSGATLPVIPQDARPDAPPLQVYFNLVGPRFFEITGARLTSGRAFADSDHSGSAPVAIISAEAARRFWPGQNPLGKTLRARNDLYQVVGIAADGRIRQLHETPRPVLYLPSSCMRFGETLLIARTRTDPAPIVKELARAAAGTSGLRIFDATTLRNLLKEALHSDWAPTVLGGSLAVIGLLLAAGGLYGAVAYVTERRQREFGVRMAVGARGRQVAVLVLRRAALLCLTGIPCGAGLFILIYRRYLVTFTHGRPLDPAALCLAAAITMATVLAGALLPAMRAARLDPVEVLRAE